MSERRNDSPHEADPPAIETNIPGLVLRFAVEEDVPLILTFIRELADYEKLLDEVVATEEILRESLFMRKAAEVIIAEYREEAAGFALFFQNFSTFLGRPGIYLEDLYIRPAHRRRGIGRTLLAFLARLAVERNCGRVEWWCLDWNEASIRFYKDIGAVPMDEWTVYRLSDHALKQMAGKFSRITKPE